ncbi:MAG: hypothetical protein ABIH35_04020 [Patescibacteria group bacterium]
MSIKGAVFATVAWFDVFGQPVSAEEVHHYLFWERAKISDVKQALESDRRIGKSFGFYFLQGKSTSVLRRCQRQYRSGKLWRRVLRHVFILRKIPFLRLAAVGNTLAMGWPEKNSDIDLFAVARKKRLFTTRAFLTFWTQLFRMRRHGKKISGRFCLSFFVDDNSLNLEPLKIGEQDPYLAFWVVTLTPIFGNAAPEFFAANTWIKPYFPNFRLRTTQKKFRRANWLEKFLNGLLGDWLEKRLRRWQLGRASSKQKNRDTNAVVISESILKFHETDQRKEFLKEWQKRLKN